MKNLMRYLTFFLFFVSGMCKIIHSIVNRLVWPSQRVSNSTVSICTVSKIFLKFSINRKSHSLFIIIYQSCYSPNSMFKMARVGIKNLPAYKIFRCGYTVENILTPEIEGAVVDASTQIREKFPLYEVVSMPFLIRLQCDTEDVTAFESNCRYNSSHSFFCEHLEPIGASIHSGDEALHGIISDFLLLGTKFLNNSPHF